MKAATYPRTRSSSSLNSIQKPKIKTTSDVASIFRRRSVSSRDKAEFCTQLSVLLQSRVSLHRSLEVLRKQAKNDSMRRVIEQLGKEIQKGNSLAHALSLQNGVFDQLFVVTAEIGQESGRLSEVLASLSVHLEKIDSLKRKIVQALTYPALVFSVALLAVLFLLIFIVPTFAEMFRSFQMELPFTTKIVLHLSQMITSYGGYFFLGCVGMGLLTFRSLKSSQVQQKIQRLVLKLPVVGQIILTNHVARFCRTLATLLQSRVSLVEALQIAQRITTLPELRQEIISISKSVQQGHTIAEPVVDSKFFPPMVGQMIAVGEETSELDKMLARVSEFYEKDLDMKMETLSTILEPVIVLLLGFVVAAILIAMYLPMFDLVNVVGAG